jgi:hypothetical protein
LFNDVPVITVLQLPVIHCRNLAFGRKFYDVVMILGGESSAATPQARPTSPQPIAGPSGLQQVCIFCLKTHPSSVADPDPGSGAFLSLDPGSGTGIRDKTSRIRNIVPKRSSLQTLFHLAEPLGQMSVPGLRSDPDFVFAGAGNFDRIRSRF